MFSPILADDAKAFFKDRGWASSGRDGALTGKIT